MFNLKFIFSIFSGKHVPWVPEDIFFLSTLMVRGDAALTKKKISSGTQGWKHAPVPPTLLCAKK